MSKNFVVALGPVCVPKAEGTFEVVKAPTLHNVAGAEVRYAAGPSMFHIVDIRGAIVFTAPLESILWCTVDSREPELYLVDDEPPPA